MSSPSSTTFSSLQSIFSHRDMVDTLLMTLGFVDAVGDGLLTLTFFMFIHIIFNAIGEGSIEAVNESVLNLVYLTGGSFLASFMEGYYWMRTGSGRRHGCDRDIIQRFSDRMSNSSTVMPALALKSSLASPATTLLYKIVLARRQLKFAVVEYRESLEERGLRSAEEIDRKVAVYRRQLEFEFGLSETTEDQGSKKSSSEDLTMLSKYKPISLIELKYTLDVEYFDLNTDTIIEVITSFTRDNLVIQDCLREKVSNFIINGTTFIGCYNVWFFMMNRMALVASPTVVLLVIPGIMYDCIHMELTQKMRRM
ncbi:hypothetical protein ZIOFF_070384 [Zingiber officinale]|uniref:CWF21 domain-containing protein n=1 Tax=Zingiber officinale TaxID=94328 RepID=A0A8J5BIS9_ZINOF|nr:hypothetical protein ZIOFF_070384 [Zingiber officinale]